MFLIVATRVGPVPEFGRAYSVWYENPAGLLMLGVRPDCGALREAKGYEAEETLYRIESSESVQQATYDTKTSPTAGFTFTIEEDS